jgi:predicted HicB family RNase H-like nuclease
MEKVKFTLRIDEELLKQAKIRAIQENRPLNIIIEEILKQYLNK